MKAIVDVPLVFDINGKQYTVPPVGVDTGWKLTEYFAMDEEKLAKVKMTSEQLFRLALTDALWDQMRDDGVRFDRQFNAGMSALAHFKTLAFGGTPEEAQAAADGIWEVGTDPEALAAWAAANLAGSTTSPATGAAKSSTKRRASTSGTSSTKPRPANRSRSSTSSTRGT